MIAAVLDFVASKFAALTPRERAGLAMVAAAALLVTAWHAAAWAERSAASAVVASQTASNAESIRALFENEDYVRRLSDDASKVWRWSRVADDVAAEEMLAQIESLSAQAGFNNVQVALADGARSGERVGTLNFVLEADFDWAALLALLEAIEFSETSIFIRSVEVDETEVGQRIAMVLFVPIISEGPRS
ncbi:MAG: hypothetical protein ACK528_05595 [Alphaproteobacteria bacterium]